MSSSCIGLDRPWGFQEVEASRYQYSAHEGGKVSPMHRPPLPPFLQEIYLVLVSVRDRVDPRTIVRPEGLCRQKFPMTPSGIKPATFRLVVKCLNELRHRVSRWDMGAELRSLDEGWKPVCVCVWQRFEGSGRSLIWVLSQHLPEGAEVYHETVRIVSLQA